MDNFFTSLSLANKLIANKTSLLGTMSKMRQELSAAVKANMLRELQSTTVMTAGKTTITLYTYEPRKSVCILITVHPNVSIISTDTLTDFHTKTCRPTVRFPSQLPDLAATSDHSLYHKCFKEQDTQNLSNLLCSLKDIAVPDGKVHQHTTRH